MDQEKHGPTWSLRETVLKLWEWSLFWKKHMLIIAVNMQDASSVVIESPFYSTLFWKKHVLIIAVSMQDASGVVIDTIACTEYF